MRLTKLFDERPALEADIEAEAVKRARRAGWIAIKLGGGASLGNKRGWPDREFIRAAVVVFIEYKRPGGVLTAQQERRIAELRAEGMTVFVCYSADESDAALASASRGRNYFPGCEDL